MRTCAIEHVERRNWKKKTLAIRGIYNSLSHSCAYCEVVFYIAYTFPSCACNEKYIFRYIRKAF